MRRPLLQLIQAVRASYWFIPSVMLALAIALGAVVVWLDSGPAAGLFEGISWYQQSKPEGAREVLSTIAGSMITVGGVVFSITIVAIGYASSQYGPRILSNYMSDRGNQVTLGTFIATFAYSVAVLRTIYSGDSAFVPQLAVMVALLLAVCSLAVLIYYIHHLPESIHANHVIARVGGELVDGIKARFPACFGEAPEQDEQEKIAFARAVEAKLASDGDVRRIAALSNGYLQVVDDSRLLAAACAHDLVVCLHRSPGDFVYRGRTLALAWPAERVSAEVEQALRVSFSVGTRRSPQQDLLFLVDELVEIGARALSTGVNDPYTAISCVDWLTAAAAELARRQPPSKYRLDKQRQVRVVARPGSFAKHLERGFGRMRPYLAGDINAATHAAAMLGSLAGQCNSAEQVARVREQLDRLVGLAARKLEPELMQRLEKQAAEARDGLDQAGRRCLAQRPNG